MTLGAFDQRLRAGLGIFLQQVALQRAGIDADAHRTAVVPRRGDDLPNAVHRADITGIDAQAGGTRLRRLDGTAIVKVNIRDDRYLDRLDDVGQCPARVLVGTGHADDIRTRRLQRPHLIDGRLDIGRHRVGH